MRSFGFRHPIQYLLVDSALLLIESALPADHRESSS